MLLVEGEQMRDAINLYDGYEHCVVHLDALHGVGSDQASPFLVGSQTFRDELKALLDQARLALGRLQRKPQPTSRRYRSRADVPKLD